MRRRLARFAFVTVCSVLATVLGTVTALTVTQTGHRTLAQLVSAESARYIRGSLAMSRVSGSFTRGLILENVVVRDTAGVTLAEIPVVEVEYGVANLFTRRIVLDRLELTRPTIRIRKRRGGRMNFQEVFRLGEGTGNGSSPLVEFRDVRILGGDIEIRSPWDPAPELTTDASRDSALAVERAKPGRQIELEADGLTRVRRIVGLEARLPLLRIATPEGDPLLARIASLAGRMSDPGIDLRDARGEVTTAGDSLRFDLSHVALPATIASGNGRLTWPGGPVLFDFRFTSDSAALTDFRWVSPLFPDMTGRAVLTALSRNSLQTDYSIEGLSLRDEISTVNGSLVAVNHRLRGLGWRDVTLSLHNFDLDLARPFLDTLPFDGLITGSIRANGFPARLGVDLDWTFEDASVPERPLNRLALQGRVALGGVDGLRFDSATVRAADLDLSTIRRLAPVVRLDGRLAMSGLLDGPLRNATFQGTAEHRLGSLAPSVLVGTTRLDTRGPVTSVDADLELTPLTFEPLHRTYPTLTLQGALTGRIHVQGDLSALAVDADVQGTLGEVRGSGIVTIGPRRWAVDSVEAEFSNLNLSAIRGSGVPTTLNGQIRFSGRGDSASAPVGEADLVLRSGRISTYDLRETTVRGRLRDSLITIDTLQVAWDGGSVQGFGTLGWAAPKTGVMMLTGTATSLTPFDSLFQAITGLTRNTAGAASPLAGQVKAEVSVAGSLDQVRAIAQITGEDLSWQTTRARAGSAHLSIDRDAMDGGAFRIDVQADIDSLHVGGFSFPLVQGFATGKIDSLRWSIHGHGADEDLAAAAAAGSWQRFEAGAVRQTLAIDSLSLDLARHRWRLQAPTLLSWAEDRVSADTTRFAATDGSGIMELAGLLPGTTNGNLTVRAAGIGLADLYGMLQRETAGVAGTLTLDAEITGSAASPRIRGTGSIAGPRFGDLRAPFARGAFFYDQRSFAASLTFWRTGTPVLEVEGRVPLDLAFGRGVQRQIPGDLAIRARADSMDLAVIGAFTPNLRRVAGSLMIDATVLGNWDAPRLGGLIRVQEGRLEIPGLGVGYGPISGAIQLAGDSILVDSLRINGQGDGGWLDVAGGVRLARLTQPILGLNLSAQRFQVMDLPEFLRLRANLNLQLRGTFAHPVLTGSGSATNSVLYFSDLITKNIVNLEDPLNRDLVDSVALRRGRLGASFQSRFLDSLRIDRFNLRVSEDVWLRSTEANIQLEGSVVVDKVGRRGYAVTGTLNAVRGTYALKMNVVTREFVVGRGVVKYLGTPDLNAELDLEARHLVRSVDAQAEDLQVIARITGTLLNPRLRLESDSRIPLSQSDLASLLVFGRLERNFDAGVALEALTSALASEVSRTVVSSTTQGVPDLFEIRPGAVQGTGLEIRGLTQVVAGWQIGRRWFVTFNAGFCPGGQEFTYRTLGASLEYRLHRDLNLQLNAEPVQFCGATQTVSLRDRSRYQFGGDLRWDRDY